MRKGTIIYITGFICLDIIVSHYFVPNLIGIPIIIFSNVIYYFLYKIYESTIK